MSTNNRITIVDALRGFAMLGIIIIACFEHFDVFKDAKTHIFFTSKIENPVSQFVLLFFNGKVWPIFALLFGLSFHIQINKYENAGIDFRPKFIWRLIILLFIGFIHSLIFKGDTLQYLAVFGLFLVLVYRLPSITLSFLSILLVLQIPIIIKLVLSFVNKDFHSINLFDEKLWSDADIVYANGSFSDLLAFNLWKGRLIAWSSSFFSGQYLQMIALFFTGILLGRVKFFEEMNRHLGLLIKALIMCTLLVLLFGFMHKSIMISEFSEVQKSLITILIHSWSNLAFSGILIILFILLFSRFQSLRFFKLLAACGQMSLSNYVFLSIFGIVFFYGFGFGMFKYMSASWSLVLAILIFYIQLNFSNIWLKYFNYGPLEWLWRALTFMDFSIKFRKEKETDLITSIN